MKDDLKRSLTSMLLRGLTLVSKFVLLIYLVHYFDTESVGIYGLVTVTVTVALYFLGADFYVYSTREIIGQPPQRLPHMVRNQLVLHGLAYVFVLPSLLTLFVSGMIAWKYLPWFYAILILEHLSQESYRLLIAISKPMRANFVLFLRSGAWMYVVVAVGLSSGNLRQLQTVWFGWTIGAALSLVVAAYILRDYEWSRMRQARIDWNWIRSGMKICLPYLLSSICLLAVQFTDRYVITAYHGKSQLGIYTVFAQIVNAVQLLVTTGVTSLIYPKLIAAHQRQDERLYRSLFRKMTGGVVAGTVVFSTAVALGMPLLLSFLGKPELTEYTHLLWILLLGNGLMTLSYIPHYALYARRKDNAVIWSTLAASIGTISLNCLLVPTYGLYGAAAGTLIGAGLLLTAKLAMNMVTSRRRSKIERTTVTADYVSATN